MSFFTKKKILVTHNSTFHADDIFATAILSLYYKGNIKVIRTRDQEPIDTADIVYDVGGVYDEASNRFDHHQEGGAGKRDNGVPYASAGLVWKKYGEEICASLELANKIDEKIIQAIDANDNGIELFTIRGEVAPYTLQDILYLFRPSWKEKEEYDTPFMEMVSLAEKILQRQIIRTRDALYAEATVKSFYDQAEDKRLIILDGNYPYGETLGSYPEPLYVVFPKAGNWRVECVRKEKHSFLNRKNLPKEWAGKRDEELARASGVPDALFCHNGLFLAVAQSKEGAVALANKALVA